MGPEHGGDVPFKDPPQAEARYRCCFCRVWGQPSPGIGSWSADAFMCPAPLPAVTA
jgi:hypothetical protein